MSHKIAFINSAYFYCCQTYVTTIKWHQRHYRLKCSLHRLEGAIGVTELNGKI
jgi:hypothetical protein